MDPWWKKKRRRKRLEKKRRRRTTKMRMMKRRIRMRRKWRKGKMWPFEQLKNIENVIITNNSSIYKCYSEISNYSYFTCTKQNLKGHTVYSLCICRPSRLYAV